MQLTHDIADFTARIDAHSAADLLTQGMYYDKETGKGCFIGCIAHSNDATVLTVKYGIPLILVKVLENIFEALPKKEAAEFFTEIPRAIGKDGKDLSKVVWLLLASELCEFPKAPHIETVIDGLNMLGRGKIWPYAARAAYAAVDAAVDAARAVSAARAISATNSAYVARAAANATYAAAYAARAARAAAYADAANAATDAARATDAADAARATNSRLRQRDKILQLMSDAK